jgi:hypothetical protein
MAPAFAIGGAIDQSLKNSSMRKRAYASAEDTCLKPVVLAETLGSEHADVASALRNLANGYANHTDYAAAEPLYQRALEIQEKVLGPESAEVATTLETYAAVLQSTHREERATDPLARAGAIRASAEPHPDPAPEPTTERASSTPGNSIEPAIASAPAAPAADE